MKSAKQYRNEKLIALENRAVSRLVKLPRRMLKKTADKEKILAEINYHRDIIDACQLSLCY